MTGLAVLTPTGRVLYRAPGVMGQVLEAAAREGVELEYADLRGEDLHGCDLHGLRAPMAVLAGANLTGCNLVGADLQHANLTGACADGADLSFAKLNGAILDWVTGRAAKGLPPECDDTKCDGCHEDIEEEWEWCPFCGKRIW